ncbi:oxygen-independent coproporphyrinogen III oxidase [Erythrobacter sp. SAORIC-644]|uniref:oxygen-independent coproporphyrinogen III oxidase n=1 Tax=Erythrobacter sp. SAORIC-644 TaxID=1869314 RepID=UPI000C8B20A8|nr:oxygen-independent coproporphyrinogen III oxidase [Erythrobacter sp. SAORIC-644]MAG42434.1 oxygen-independent coproporphyrinogen III oxidase [Erythrobacteraceae bacterium]PNQ77445.1 oxygen-independent coproporphyrinogen III oxidase [Erythrobacter sp. SAORIC-644]
MWPYHPDLLATPVPRYTSYPTAAEFGRLSATQYEEAMGNASGAVSLYIHIPFCEKICYYCGCNTGKSGKRQRLESYLDALACEIDLVSDILPSDAHVRRIAFGGGSPNAISPREFLALVDRLTARFKINDPTFSIELDPRTFSADWAQAIGSVGIERASLGVQTFAPHCQEAIGRVQPESLIERSVELLRENGVTSLNFDLMYGLPHQSQNDLHDSFQRTIAMGPDRIALFGYAHVPHLIARQRVIEGNALPGLEERFAMAMLGHACLTEHGYRSIGFDHFAKPSDPLAQASATGKLRRNFQGFTDDQSPVLIGLGSSAVSSFPTLLAQNEKNSGRYRMQASQSRLTTALGIARTNYDGVRAKIIEALLCRGSARIARMLDEPVLDALRPFIELELATLDNDELSITASGLPYARVIAALFDTYRPQSVRRFSSAV